MTSFPTPRPILIDASLSGDLAVPDEARVLALVVHPNLASMARSGHCFLADVLRSNRVATLSIGLRTLDEERGNADLPDSGEVARRLRRVQAWLAQASTTRHLRLGLIAVDDAVTPCIEASRLPGLDAVRALVAIDGHPDLRQEAVADWRWPTLCLAGRNGWPGQARSDRLPRTLPAPHRLVRLVERTLPSAGCGAFQAIACEATSWLAHTVPQAQVVQLRRPAPVSNVVPVVDAMRRWGAVPLCVEPAA